MNFLAPLFLLGALAVAGPVIFHLVRRTTRERTRFSSLQFLEPSPPRLSRRHRVEHWLLLVLRALALLLLAFGFARPFLPQTPPADPAAGPARRVVVLLDRSASMRRAGLWDDACARVRTLLAGAGPTDQFAVLAFDRAVTPVLDFAEWKATAPAARPGLGATRLAALSPSWGSTQLGRALVAAAELLSEEEAARAGGPRQIVLVSDLQAGSRLEALQAFEWPRGVELALEPVVARSRTNAGLQWLADSPDAARGPDAPVRVRVSNAPGAERERFQLAWQRPAAPTGAVATVVGAPIDAYVPPGESRTFAVARPAGTAGDERLVLTGDDDPFDNVLHVVTPAPERPLVLWIGRENPDDATAPLFFLRRAYAGNPAVAVRVVARAPDAPIPPAEIAEARLIVVSGAAPASLDAAVRARIEAGGCAVFLPRGAAAEEGATLGRLAGTGPVALREARPASPALWSELDFRHPLFAAFADARFSDFTRIRVWRHREVDAAALPGTKVPARFDSGLPAVLELAAGRGRLLVWTGGWHPEESQLAVSSKFVPLVWSLLELAGGRGSFSSQHGVGDGVTLPAEAAAGPVRVPGGAEVPVPAGGTFGATQEPGVYVAGVGPTAVRFAVNVDAAESRTAPLGREELEQAGVPLARPAPPGPATAADAALLESAEAEARQKLWRWLLAATLVILVVETMLAGRLARGRAAPASSP